MPFCEHGLNPSTCLTCFRKPKPGAAQARRGPDVERNALGAPMGTLPGRQAVPKVGDRTGSDVGKAVSGSTVTEEERAKYREGLERASRKAVPLSPEQQANLRTEGFTRVQAWGVDRDGHEVPPPRDQIIDQQPSHPKAGT